MHFLLFMQKQQQLTALSGYTEIFPRARIPDACSFRNRVQEKEKRAGLDFPEGHGGSFRPPTSVRNTAY